MGMLNVFGGNGFVGSQFCNTTKNGYFKNYRENIGVFSPDVVYFISTVDNYNVHVDPTLDIHTNLTILVKVLDNYKAYIKSSKQPGCFNFISSWFVYGRDSGFGEGSIGISETDLCDPKGFFPLKQMIISEELVICLELLQIQITKNSN